MFSLRTVAEIVSIIYHLGNFLSSQLRTSRWSEMVARRIWISSFWRDGRSKVRFRAPSLQIEQIARKLLTSSVPPIDLSTMWPM